MIIMEEIGAGFRVVAIDDDTQQELMAVDLYEDPEQPAVGLLVDVSAPRRDDLVSEKKCFYDDFRVDVDVG